MEATDTIIIDGREVLCFHPTHKKIKDSIPRCISCGQIDEPDYHKAEWCPGMGGDLPFPTSTVKINLKSDSGFRSESSQRISLNQWRLINIILNAEDGRITRPIIDQNCVEVGTDHTKIKDLLSVEGYMDTSETVWTPPTAFAYQAVCKAHNAKTPSLLTHAESLNAAGLFDNDAQFSRIKAKLRAMDAVRGGV